jgi:hypothetical protein
MIKTTVNSKEPQSPAISYPILMECLEGGPKLIVRFVSETTGAVVNENELYTTFDRQTNWVPATNKRVWKPFVGQIILENINQ